MGHFFWSTLYKTLCQLVKNASFQSNPFLHYGICAEPSYCTFDLTFDNKNDLLTQYWVQVIQSPVFMILS